MTTTINLAKQFKNLIESEGYIADIWDFAPNEPVKVYIGLELSKNCAITVGYITFFEDHYEMSVCRNELSVKQCLDIVYRNTPDTMPPAVKLPQEL